MSTAIAMAPSPAPHDRPSFSSELASPTAQRTPAPLTATTAAPMAPAASSVHVNSEAPNASIQRSGSGSPLGAQPASGLPAAAKSSPPNAARNGNAPKIFVKKEPGSPDHTPRRRPVRLDLSKGASTTSNTPGTGRPLTARDGLGIQEVGLACLSPGFVTQDPVMKEQLQRSMSVREQQRHIIEARLQQQSAKGDGPEQGKEKDGAGNGPATAQGHGQFAAKTPGMSRRNKAPPGLSIVAPSHEQFAHERVIQSAPLGQTFTGMSNPHPLTRHITNQPSKLSNTSHIHHVPAHQTNNRLPPLADVFGQGLSAGHAESAGHHHAMFPQQQQNSAAAGRGPLASPSHPPPPTSHTTISLHTQTPAQAQGPAPNMQREYKSAEEAQAELAGGRPELLPKIVHYGGHQPPTPPSPQPGHPRAVDASRSASRRRTRAEYEEGASPPLGTGRAARRGPFGDGRDSPETQRQKREEFLRLCERAWDLFHS